MSKEYWIYPHKDNMEGVFYAKNKGDVNFNIHVIEYSAYEELTRQNGIMKKGLLDASVFEDSKFAQQALEQIKPRKPQTEGNG